MSGCLTGFFAFSLPPLFYLCIFWDEIVGPETRLPRWQQLLTVGFNSFLVVMGFVASSVFTVVLILDQFK